MTLRMSGEERNRAARAQSDAIDPGSDIPVSTSIPGRVFEMKFSTSISRDAAALELFFYQ
jgi:hypothetical protein